VFLHDPNFDVAQPCGRFTLNDVTQPETTDFLRECGKKGIALPKSVQRPDAGRHGPATWEFDPAAWAAVNDRLSSLAEAFRFRYEASCPDARQGRRQRAQRHHQGCIEAKA
jgi:hypothetical protein